MRFPVLRTALLVGCLMPGGADARYMGAYDYPFVSALAATVAATPPANQARMISDSAIDQFGETRFVEVFPGRPIPEVFWYYEDGLPYTVYRQRNPRAPLVFLIGGTGAGHDSAKSRLLVRALFSAGFHVVSIASPTHPSFIVTASEESIPGRLEVDAADLYRVMGLIDDSLRDELEVTGYYVAGYSLGGAHAAFVSRLDEREKRFGFQKAVVINPPVSLYNSVSNLDDMFDRHLSQDPAAVNAFIDRIFRQVIALYDVRDRIDFTDDTFLYRAYALLEPPERDLELLIGLAFRFTSNDMAFASDVMTNAGYVVPKDARLTATTSLTDVFVKGMGLNFVDYFDDVYVPFTMARHPEATRESLIRAASLASIEGYLRSADRVVMLGTQDDVILAPGEVRWLESVFGERARIFPTGGHCGSMDQHQFVAAMLELMGR